MSRSTSNALIRDFTEWLAEHHPDDDSEVRTAIVTQVRGILAHAEHTVEGDADFWTVHRLTHVAEHVIEGEALDGIDVDTMLGAFREFLHYLDDTDQLSEESDDFDALDAALAELTEQYGSAAGWRISLPKDVEIPAVILAPDDVLLDAAMQAATASKLVPAGDTLDDWSAAFQARLDDGVLTAVSEGEPSQWAQMLETVVVDLLVVLYMRGSITRKEFDELGWAVTAGAVTKRSKVEKRQMQRLHTEADADISALIAQLETLGVVAHDTDADRLKLTPLGRWIVNQLLTEREYAAPVVKGLDDPTAAKLLRTLPELRADDMGDVLEAWVARRQPAEVVSELADLVEATAEDDSDTEGERLAVSLALFRDAIELLPDSAEAEVRAAIGRPLLQGMASSWLSRRLGASDARIDLTGDLDDVVLTLSPLVLSSREQDAVALVAEAGDTAQQLAFIDRLWRRPEADSGEVLNALAEHHPDKAVAKAAKKAAFKRKSAGLP